MPNSHTMIEYTAGLQRHGLATLRLVLVCLCALSTHAGAAGLSLAQEAQALSVSDKAAWQSTISARTLHPLGLQTLFVEKQESKNQTTVRWVRVYQYHYADQSARMLVIDLVDNTVSREQPIDSIHLPLNTNEIAFAQSLILEDSALMQQLHAEQLRRAQPPTQDLTDLDVKASIFEPLDSEHPCFTQRCALLSLFDQTRTVFAVEPVVLLNSLQVQLLNQ